MTEKLAYRVPEAAKQIGIGNTKMWELIRSKRIPAIKIDDRITVIRHSDIVAFLKSLPVKNSAQS